jgi:hypothetical protein
VERCTVGKIAAQPVEAFRQHRIKTTCLGRPYKVLQTGAIDHRRAGDRGIGEFRSNEPPLPGGVLACQGDLVGYRSGVLEVRTEPGVDGDAHGDVPSLACSAA